MKRKSALTLLTIPLLPFVLLGSVSVIIWIMIYGGWKKTEDFYMEAYFPKDNPATKE